MLSPAVICLRALVALLAQAVPPPPAATAADDRMAALERQLHELQLELAQQKLLAEATAGADVSSAGEGGSEPMLRLYGFADTGVQRTILGPHSSLAAISPANATTFVLGNLNVYFDAQPTPQWRALMEVRLTTYPEGTGSNCGLSPDNSAQCPRIPTRIYDINSASGGWSTVRWSGIVLERAYLQWQHSDRLTVRAGFFLTPFGIWNLDHGSPTTISLMLPMFEVNQLFPTQQLGVQVLGTFHLDDWELDYHATVSNGRPFGQVDPTDDKMFGGRLVLRRAVPFPIAIGASALAGRYAEGDRIVTSTLPYTLTRFERVAYDERAGGVDASIDFGRLRVRSELAVRRVKFEEGKRSLVYGQEGLYTPDFLEWDVYALAAYQLPWGFEPFVYMEVYRFPTWISEGIVAPSVGFNVHFTPAAQLKFQYQNTRFVNFSTATTDAESQHNAHLLGLRLVLAF